MRPILSAAEYESLLQHLTVDEVRQAATATVSAAREIMAEHDLQRAVVLCGKSLQGIAELTAKALEAPLAIAGRDELPALDRSLICDLLLFSTSVEPWFEAMNSHRGPILSVGIPAGVDPDTGRAKKMAVQAKITVAPFAYLSGLFLQEGLDHCGEIRPIGGQADTGDGVYRFESEDAKRLLPPRKRTAHKGDSGKALLCVGSPKYVGAALLSARACLAAGCGILFVACPDVVRAALGRLPEAIGVPVGVDWDADSCAVAIQAMKGMQALGLGCGVGHGDVSTLIKASLLTKLPLVLDADSLNCLSRHPELYPLLHDRVVLTPHPGEMSRLAGLPVRQVLDDPIAIARKHAERWGCTVLLKGAATVVSDGTRAHLIAEGNAGLGKGGSGDVLTGIVTGLLAQGVAPFDAARLGSYLLGTSADRAFDLLKERMLRATNVIEALEDWNE